MVHNFGGLCDCENIYKIAQKYNLTIIEDFSESLLSKFNNKFLGGQQKNSKLKIISFSSLHATKTITTGEGGIITTNSQKTCFNIKNLRDHGINKYKAYHYKQIGGNFRLSNILAAMGYAQLSRVNQIIKKKREINNLYIKNLKNIEGIKLQKDLIESNPVKWGFPVRLHNSFYVKKIIRELKKINIKAIPAFISFNKFKYLKIYYNKNNNKSDFKNSELLQNSLVVLPLNLKLTKNDIIFICKNIKKILGNHK
jgi:perosamine synthetase